jgi:mono/diheme cytochrome c family protein
VLVLCGCAASEPLRFRLNAEGRDPARISRPQREAIVDTLRDLFGTPDEPAVPPGVELGTDLLPMAAGPIGSGEDGSQWGLYRKHCAGCHGISGDGAGPRAALFDPYPRDFRHGVYKYTSTAGGAKPARADLERTLRRGMPGTAMPSFDTLSDREIAALMEYMVYFGIRGETELYLLQLVIDEDEYPVDKVKVVREGALPAAASWRAAEKTVVQPPPPPPLETAEQWTASLARGRELYASTDARCVQCHGPAGKGDGEQSELYDDWNKRKKGVTPPQTKELARLFRLPIQQLYPRNFTEGIFHGGPRPVDIYWRISVGIKGTPMPAAGPAPGSSGTLKPEDIWHVVNFVRSLGDGGRRWIVGSG